MTNVQLSEHFHSSEFDCHGEYCNCGGRGDLMNPLLIRLLEKLRYNCGGYPLYINCGYRCAMHNAEINGAYNSQHLYFNAADVACPEQMSIEEFKWYVDTTRVDGLGFDGIGVYYPEEGDFIHVDVRDNGTRPGYYRW